MALYYFVFEGNFLSTSPRGTYIWSGDLTESFLCYRFGGLIFGGAYRWKGLFSEFYGMSTSVLCCVVLIACEQALMLLGDIVKSTLSSGDATARGTAVRSLVQMESLLAEGFGVKPMLNTKLN